MKSKIAFLLAAVMAVTSLGVNSMAASSNSVSDVFKDMKKDEVLVKDVGDRSIGILDNAIDSIASGTAVSLQIKPTSEIRRGESIILEVENGKFDKRIVDADPFIFRTEQTGTTFSTIMDEGGSINDVLTKYVGNENSRKLPYGFRYINDTMLEVYLYPIGDDKVNQNNSDVTMGTPYYDINLPITTEGSEYYKSVTINVDSNDSSISSGRYTVANVTEDGEYNDPMIFSTVNYISVNGYELYKDNVLISGVTDNSISLLNTQEGIDSLAEGKPISLNMKPIKEISMNTKFVLNVTNGKFDERLINADPFVYSTECTKTDFDYLFGLLSGGENLSDVMRTYIRNENSRKLPYKIKYIDDKNIEVTLFPISEEYVNCNNDYITDGVPYYNIALPLTTEGSELGDVVVSILAGEFVASKYTAARVIDEKIIQPSPAGNSSENSISVGGYKIDKNNVLINNIDNTSVDILNTAEGIDSLANGVPVSLYIKPKSEVFKGDSIILIAENGKFDERLVNSDPFIYKTEISKVGYDKLINDGRNSNDVLGEYIGNESSRKLPYGLRYINENQIEVFLYPIDDTHVYNDNYDVTKGIPYYNITLPMTTEGSTDGELKVGVYSNNTSIAGGIFTVAAVGDTDIYADGGNSSNIVRNIIGTYKDSILIDGLSDKNIDILNTEQGIRSLKFGSPQTLQITPLYGYNNEQSIILSIENGKFDKRLVTIDPYIFKTEITGVDYDSIMNDTEDICKALNQYIGNENSRNLPYKINYISEKEIEVKLFPIPDNMVLKDNGDVTRGIPYYNIALPVTTEGSSADSVVLNVKSNRSLISGGSYNIATVHEGDGFTSVEINPNEVKEITPGYYTVPDIVIKEGVVRSFDSQNVKVMLNGGNDWVKFGEITGYENCNNNKNAVGRISYIGRILQFKIGSKSNFDTEKLSSIIIKGFVIDARTEGDITISISGDRGITEQTIVIGKVSKHLTESTTEVTTNKADTTTESTSAVTENTTEVTTNKADTTTEGTSAVTEYTTEVATNKSDITTESASVVTENSTETTTNSAESSTETITTIETTTKRISSGGGGGGNSTAKVNSTTTSTTETTTEKVTEMSTEAISKTETSTETTTQSMPEVKVVIGSKGITIDNKTYSMDAAPYIQSSSNSTLVPLRFISVALTGGNMSSANTSDIITWDSENKQATIIWDGINIVFKAGSNEVVINGNKTIMNKGVTAEIRDGRMFVPFRVIGEVLGYNVEWEADSKTAVYKTK